MRLLPRMRSRGELACTERPREVYRDPELFSEAGALYARIYKSRRAENRSCKRAPILSISQDRVYRCLKISCKANRFFLMKQRRPFAAIISHLISREIVHIGFLSARFQASQHAARVFKYERARVISRHVTFPISARRQKKHRKRLI